MSGRAEISGDHPLAVSLRTSPEAMEIIEALVIALAKARNTLAGCGMPSIAADICDAALAKAEQVQS